MGGWVDGWAVGLWLWLGGKVTVSYGSWLVGGKMNGMGGLVEMRNSHFFIFFPSGLLLLAVV